MRSSNLQIKHISIGKLAILNGRPKNTSFDVHAGVIRIEDIFLWKKDYMVEFKQDGIRQFGEWKHMRNNLIIK